MDEHVSTQKPRTRRSFFIPRRFLLPLALLIILAIGAAAFFGGRMSVYKAHPELTNVEQAEAVLVKVGKLIKLPEGEMPSMATIEDAESVKAGQPFLASAEDGDILIVYAEAATALLYRPSTNILIAVGPVTGETPQEPEMTEVAPLDEETDTEDTASSTEE